MIHRDDVPDTPEWSLPARDPDADTAADAASLGRLTIPDNIVLGTE